MYTRDLRSWVELELKEGELFLAKTAYDLYFQDMLEATFYQLLARLNKEKLLAKYAKGLYYKPYKNDFSRQPEQDKIIDFLTDKSRKGMVIGPKMYADLQLIDDDVDYLYEVYTNKIEIKSVRVFNGIKVRTVDLDFKKDELVRHIQMLEIIETIDDFENVNIRNLYKFLELYTETFNQADFLKVLAAKSYKKRNIAIVVDILKAFGVKNTLSKLLNSASRYKKSDYIMQAINYGE